MNKTNMSFLVLFSLLVSGCDAIAGIFKAGVWVGIIGVVILVALILWLIGKAKK